MSATFFLVRHASHDLLGRVLAGRMEGVSLSELGKDEAKRLAKRFSGTAIAAVHSSPLLRARETAEIIAASHGLPVQIEAGLNEIHFGAWTGMQFDALQADPQWARWNGLRSVANTPGGESMLEAQLRAVRHVLAAAEQFSGGAVVLVSHQDVIKSVLAHALGIGLDGLERFEIGPASVSAMTVADWGVRVLSMNEAVPS